jgi:hypothetical protein
MIHKGYAVSDLVAYDRWLAEIGISACSGWRFRKRGAIQTVSLYGRLYVSRAAIAEFERRAAAGEFARAVKPPRTGKSRSEAE